MDGNWLLCFVWINFVSIQALQLSNDNLVVLRRFINYLNRDDLLDAQKDTLMHENYKIVPSNDNLNGETYYGTSPNLHAVVKTDGTVNHKSANKKPERGNGRYSDIRNENRYKPRKSIKKPTRENLANNKKALRALVSYEESINKLNDAVPVKRLNKLRQIISNDYNDIQLVKSQQQLSQPITHEEEKDEKKNKTQKMISYILRNSDRYKPRKRIRMPYSHTNGKKLPLRAFVVSSSESNTNKISMNKNFIQHLKAPTANLVGVLPSSHPGFIQTLQGNLGPIQTVSQPNDDEAEPGQQVQITSDEDNLQSDKGPSIVEPNGEGDVNQSANSEPIDPPNDHEEASQSINSKPNDRPSDDDQFIPGKALLQPSIGNENPEDSALKFPKQKLLTHLVYGNPDNLSITYGKTPYRVQNTGFRKINNLVDMFGTTILKSNSGPKKWIVIAITPKKKKPNPSLKMIRLVKVRDEVNDASEILDGFDLDGGEDSDYRRKKSKSKFRDRKLSYESSSSEESSSSSSGSSDEKNPGNPYTLHKGKYKQNWMWNHNMDGDHMNINPYGPLLSDLSPTGETLFFGRKWWYFNQDDYKPMG